MTYTAYVSDDLFNAGTSCDGHPFFAEQYYVVIQNDRGRRFRHNAIFKGTERQVCEETGDPCFPNLREEARAKAERLCARVNAALVVGNDLDRFYWDEVDPAYGSEEYVSQGIEQRRWIDERYGV